MGASWRTIWMFSTSIFHTQLHGLPTWIQHDAHSFLDQNTSFHGPSTLHHPTHISSSMSPKSQENVKLERWFMVVDQRKSTSQNWGSIDPISFNFCHIKMIPRETLLKMTFQKTLMLKSRRSFAWKVFFYGERL